MTKVLVIGDIIIDKYIYGTSNRLSPEGPIPIVNLESVRETSGGAGNLFENLKSLGVDADLLTYDGDKSVKTRVFSDSHYVTRIDEDHIIDGDQMLLDIKKIDFSPYTYVVLSDYAKGVLTYAKEIIAHINTFGCKVIVDPKRDASHYEGAWLIKPNKLEETQYNFSEHDWNWIVTDSNLPVRAKIDNISYTIQPKDVDVNDVTGAGDCFLAAFVYALVDGITMHNALKLACAGATESVKHVGTYVLEERDLKKKVIFTNGCFDVLHKGHLTLLKKARNMGDKLIVGLNSDSSVNTLKGGDRPFNDIQTRIEQLELIPYVDEVIVFDEYDPILLIKKLRPDIIVKGGDYRVEEVVGHDIAPVRIIPLVEGYSTTEILKDRK